MGAYVLEEGDVDGWDVSAGQQIASASCISAQFSSYSSVIIANSITCPQVAPFASGYGMTVDSSTVRPSGQTGQGVSGSSTMGAGVGSLTGVGKGVFQPSSSDEGSGSIHPPSHHLNSDLDVFDLELLDDLDLDDFEVLESHQDHGPPPCHAGVGAGEKVGAHVRQGGYLCDLDEL